MRTGSRGWPPQKSRFPTLPGDTSRGSPRLTQQMPPDRGSPRLTQETPLDRAPPDSPSRCPSTHLQHPPVAGSRGAPGQDGRAAGAEGSLPGPQGPHTSSLHTCPRCDQPWWPGLGERGCPPNNLACKSHSMLLDCSSSFLLPESGRRPGEMGSELDARATPRGMKISWPGHC